MDNHRRTRHYSHSDNYSAHDVLARLKHDPTAPPFASLTCVLQLAGSGDVPVVGTCRGFVRSLRTCKYLTGCRYSHELKSLNDEDMSWAASSRAPEGGGEKISIARVAPLARVLELVDAGLVDSSALVHVLVSGEGVGGLGGLAAPHRQLWSAFERKRLWEDGAEVAGGGSGGGGGGGINGGGGGGGDFAGLAAFLVPPPGATLLPLATVGGGAALPTGISPCLLGLPQLALACVASFLPDNALLSLRVTCSEMATQLDDVGVWMPRLKRLPAWGAWSARNAAVLAPPAAGAGPLAAGLWGAALRRAFFSIGATCEWAAGLRFLREALVLRALVHAPPPRPAAGPLLGGAAAPGVRWRLPSLDLCTPSTGGSASAAAAPPPPPPPQPPAPLLLAASVGAPSRSSSPAPSPAPSPVSFSGDSRPTSPVVFERGSSGGGGCGGGGGGGGGGKKGGGGKRRSGGGGGGGCGGKEGRGGSNTSSARKAGRAKQRAYSAASEEDARDSGVLSDASSGSRASRRVTRRGSASAEKGGGGGGSTPASPLPAPRSYLRDSGGGGSPRSSGMSLAQPLAAEKPVVAPTAGALARQVASAVWHLRAASCASPLTYAPTVSALTSRLLRCLTHAPPAPSSCRVAAEALSEVLLAFSEGRPCPDDALGECLADGGSAAARGDASPPLRGADFEPFFVDAAAALSAPVPPRSSLAISAAGLDWYDSDVGAGVGSDTPGTASGGAGGGGGGTPVVAASNVSSPFLPSNSGSGGLFVMLKGHGTPLRGGVAITALASGLAAPIRALAVDRARLAVLDRSGALRVYGADGGRVAAGRASGLAGSSSSGGGGGGGNGSGGGGGGGGAAAAADAGRCCSHVCSLAFCDTALVTGHPDGSVIVSQLGQGQSIRPSTVVRFDDGEASSSGRRSAAPAAHSTVALLDHSSSVLCGRRLLRGDAAPFAAGPLSLHCAESGEQQRLLRPGGGRGGAGAGAVVPSSPSCIRALGDSAPFLAAVGYTCGLVRLWDLRAAREAAVLSLWGGGAPTPDDAGCAVTHIAVEGHTLVDARACPLAAPAEMAPEGGAPQSLSSPWVRLWDTRRCALPVGRLDLGGHALRAVTGLHVGAQAVLVTHAHVFRPSAIAALRLGFAQPLPRRGGGRARRAPHGHWDAAGRPRGLGGPSPPVWPPQNDAPRLWHLLGLASEGEAGQLAGIGGGTPASPPAPSSSLSLLPPAPARSSVDTSQVPEYAWPPGHAPGAHDGAAWPPGPHFHAPQRRGRAPPLASCSVGCTELPRGGGGVRKGSVGETSDAPRSWEGSEVEEGDGDVESDEEDGGGGPPPELMWAMSTWHPSSLAMAGWLPLPSATCLAADSSVLGIGGTAENGGGSSSIFWRFTY